MGLRIGFSFGLGSGFRQTAATLNVVGSKYAWRERLTIHFGDNIGWQCNVRLDGSVHNCED